MSQYTGVYCDCGAKARLNYIAIQCPAKPRYGQEACGAGLGVGGRRQHGRAARRQTGARGAHAASEREQTDEQAADADGRAGRGSLTAGASRRAGARQGRDRGARPGVLLGQQAVHSVHSACFWPDLTQYCS